MGIWEHPKNDRECQKETEDIHEGLGTGPKNGCFTDDIPAGDGETVLQGIQFYKISVPALHSAYRKPRAPYAHTPCR